MEKYLQCRQVPTTRISCFLLHFTIQFVYRYYCPEIPAGLAFNQLSVQRNVCFGHLRQFSDYFSQFSGHFRSTLGHFESIETYGNFRSLLFFFPVYFQSISGRLPLLLVDFRYLSFVCWSLFQSIFGGFSITLVQFWSLTVVFWWLFLVFLSLSIDSRSL